MEVMDKPTYDIYWEHDELGDFAWFEGLFLRVYPTNSWEVVRETDVLELIIARGTALPTGVTDAHDHVVDVAIEYLSRRDG